MRINSLARTICTLGETLDEPHIMKKFLRVVLSRNWFRLRASQDRFDEPNEGGGSGEVRDKSEQLMMAEEDWLAKWKHKLQPNATEGQRRHTHTYERESNGKLTSEGTPHRKGRCHNYGIYGYWAKECRKPKKEKARKDEAHLAKADVE
ncbi:hypothetical protein U9M48_031652 [Paspalum notatum var. saurae]|uniref:Uncharacterized protein n=1 Tax=Paspalum notatum var. saurae TaxID=547442 RepID=A0AAQ3U393_PASNO